MKSFVKSIRGRVIVAAGVAVVLVGAVGAAASAHSANVRADEVARVAVAHEVAVRDAAIAELDVRTTARNVSARSHAQAATDAHVAVLAGGTAVVEAHAAVLGASDGKADIGARTALAGALDELRAAVAAGSHKGIAAASVKVADTGKVVADAVAAFDVEQARVAAEVEASRVAAELAAGSVRTPTAGGSRATAGKPTESKPAGSKSSGGAAPAGGPPAGMSDAPELSTGRFTDKSCRDLGNGKVYIDSVILFDNPLWFGEHYFGDFDKAVVLRGIATVHINGIGYYTENGDFTCN